MDDDDLGGCAVLSLCDDFGESCLVRECRELQDVLCHLCNAGPLQEIRHILEKHWKELHLLKIGVLI